MKKLLKISSILFLSLALFSCANKTNYSISIERDMIGITEISFGDTILTNEYYDPSELYLRIIEYDYLVVEDSVHIYFQTLDRLDCSKARYNYNFIKLSEDKLLLVQKDIFRNSIGSFKRVIHVDDTIVNVAIKNENNVFAYSSFKVIRH